MPRRQINPLKRVKRSSPQCSCIRKMLGMESMWVLYVATAIDGSQSYGCNCVSREFAFSWIMWREKVR